MLVALDGVLMEEGIAALAGAPSPDPLDAVVLRLRAGEGEAFGELMALTDLRVLGVAWRILGDRDLAKDAAQEVYLRIHRSIAGFRPGESFRAWMHRITVNVCFDLARKRGPFMVDFADLEGAHAHAGDPAEEALLADQRRALIRRALRTLSPAERAALVLRDIEGLSTEEAATALGVKPATLRSQVSAARAKVQAFCARATRPLPGGRP